MTRSSSRIALSMIFSLALATVAAAATSAPEVRYPDSGPGRIAAAFFPAYNAGGDEAMRKFYETNVSAEGLKRRSVAERLEVLHGMRENQGRLTPLAVENATDSSVEVIVRNQAGERVRFTFLCEEAPSHGLMGIRVEDLPGQGEEAEGGGSPLETDAEVVAALRAHLESLAKNDEFSGAALLAKGTTPLLREAYGLASRAANVPNRPDTKFNLGSINKAFTRIAIEALAKDGKLKLDDTIDRYVPDYPAEKGRRITIAQLLDHKGGTGDIFGPRYDATDRTKLRALRDWMPLFADQPLRFEPGTREEYSNAGYVLLGRVIETVSGRDYYDFVRERVYAPAKMKDTDSYSQDSKVGNRAIEYTRRFGAGAPTSWRDARDNNPARGSSAGGGYATVDDLLRFARAVREDAFGTGTRGHALGIAGGSPGTNAAVETVGDYTVVVLANADPPVAERIAAKVRGWLPKPAAGVAVTRIRGGGPDDPGRKPKETRIPDAGVDVPMLKSGHLPAVRVMVNGQGPFLFAIDTGGAGVARVSAALAAKLGLETIGEVQAGDPSGKNLRTLPLVAMESIELGGARFTGLTASVRPDDAARDETADGILGFGLFADCLVTLDYPASRIRLAKGELPPANGKDVLDYRDPHGIPSVKLRVGGLEVDADVDAGSMGGFSFPEALAAKMKLVSEPRIVGHARTMTNSFDIKAAALDGDIALGGATFSNPTVEFQPMFPVANVGSRILRELSVTFDQKNRRVRMERAHRS